MKKIIFLIVITFLLAACGAMPVKPLDQQSQSIMNNKSVVVVTYNSPGFFAMTAGKAMIGGLLGAAMMDSSGRKIVKRYNIHDPSTHVGNIITAALKNRFHGSSKKSLKLLRNSDSLKNIIEHNREGLIVDIKTIDWGFTYVPTQWGHFKVNYHVRIRIIDGGTGKMLGGSGCRLNYKTNTDKSVKKAGLYDNNGAGLKRLILGAANQCTSKFLASVLGYSDNQASVLVKQYSTSVPTIVAAPKVAPTTPKGLFEEALVMKTGGKYALAAFSEEGYTHEGFVLSRDNLSEGISKHLSKRIMKYFPQSTIWKKVTGSAARPYFFENRRSSRSNALCRTGNIDGVFGFYVKQYESGGRNSGREAELYYFNCKTRKKTLLINELVVRLNEDLPFKGSISKAFMELITKMKG